MAMNLTPLVSAEDVLAQCHPDSALSVELQYEPQESDEQGVDMKKIRQHNVYISVKTVRPPSRYYVGLVPMGDPGEPGYTTVEGLPEHVLKAIDGLRHRIRQVNETKPETQEMGLYEHSWIERQPWRQVWR